MNGKFINLIIIVLLILAFFSTVLGGYSNNSNITAQPRTSFITDKQIGFDPADYNQNEPSIAVAGSGVIYVVWEDFREGNWDVFFAKSIDNGNTWFGNEVVNASSPQGTYQRHPTIAIDSNNYIYLAFEENVNGDWDIYFTKSMDGGATWTTQRPVHETQDPYKIKQFNPSISIDTEDNIYIVWSANTTISWDIYLARSIDSGFTWSEQIQVNDDFGSKEPVAPAPSIDIDGSDNIYIVWEDKRQGTNDIYFANSSDGGNTFYTNIQVNDGVRDGSKKVNTKYPKVQVNPRGDIYVVWEEEWNSVYNVYFSKSLNHGQSFDTDVRVNGVIDKCYPGPSPAMGLDDNGNIYVVWIDSRNANHTYFAASENGGLSFTGNTQVDDTDSTPVPKAPQLTYAQLEKARPNLVVANENNKIYIVWTDYRNDQLPGNGISENGDIYFDRTTTLSDKIPTPTILDHKNIGSNYIELAWSLNQDPDFSEYLLYKSTAPNFDLKLSKYVATISERSTTEFNLTGLTPTTTYYFKIRTQDTNGNWNDSNELKVTTITNSPPLIALSEPDGDNDVADTYYLIRWVDSDSDDNATIKLYYDQNAIEGDEFFIATVPQGEDSFLDFYLWNTTSIPNGQYFIKAVIIDSVNQTYSVYSSGRVMVHHGELIPPEIIVTKPAPGSVKVSVNTEISVIFTEEIDANTLTILTFYIVDSSANRVSGNYSFDNTSNNAFFTPAEPLEYDENYTATITTGIRDLAGNALESGKEWWFITESLIIKRSLIKGRVLDQTTGDVIPTAKLYFKGVIPGDLTKATGLKYQTTSDATGNYELEVEYGTYELTIQAADYQILEGLIINLTINLKNQNFYLTAPVITKFSWSDSDGDGKATAGEKIKFSAQAVDPENDTLLFVWNFGDGSTNAIGESVTHKYKESGNYEVTLIVTDLNGGNTTNTTSIRIESEEFNLVSFGIWIITIILIIIIIIAFLYARRVRVKRQARELEAFRMVKFERAFAEGEEEEEMEPDILEGEEEEEELPPPPKPTKPKKKKAKVKPEKSEKPLLKKKKIKKK